MASAPSREVENAQPAHFEHQHAHRKREEQGAQVAQLLKQQRQARPQHFFQIRADGGAHADAQEHDADADVRRSNLHHIPLNHFGRRKDNADDQSIEHGQQRKFDDARPYGNTADAVCNDHHNQAQKMNLPVLEVQQLAVVFLLVAHKYSSYRQYSLFRKTGLASSFRRPAQRPHIAF